MSFFWKSPGIARGLLFCFPCAPVAAPDERVMQGTLDRQNRPGGSDHGFGYTILQRGDRVIIRTGNSNLPTDPDHDGIFENLNANDQPDFADIVLSFSRMEWIAAKEPLSAFELNNNTRIDFTDIVALFGEV